MNIISFSLLSDTQCDRLIQDGAGIKGHAGRLYGADEDDPFEVDQARYKASEVYIDLLPPFSWLRNVLLAALSRSAGSAGYASLKLLEMPRLLTYETGDHFDRHIDTGLRRVGEPTRRVTASIQLTGADDYAGGDLLVKTATGVHTASRVRGDVTVFSADAMHKVAPVTSGTRAALVWWGY